MKKQYVVLFVLLILSQTLFAQYKNDNVLYQTVYIEDLCKQLKLNSDYILLDVRSKGEHDDTSYAAHLNIGHLKNARNISISELPKRWQELSEFKNKPVYVYCSHSQRSRRASKLLADSGFSKVYNINGGLTTFHLAKEKIANCPEDLFETRNPYRIVSPSDFCKRSEAGNIFILDIRKDSIFKGISLDERQNAIGNLKGAVNIPLQTLATSIDKLPSDKEIIIVDEYGNESPQAAKLLMEKGFKNVGILFNGMEMWVSTNEEDVDCKTGMLTRNRNYSLLTPEEFYELASAEDKPLIIDVRKEEEYNNKSKDSWRNIGRIEHSTNIPFDSLSARLPMLELVKNKPVIFYSFSNQPEVFKAAKLLTDKGFSNISILIGGIFNVRWKAANLKGLAHLKKLVIDTPPENM